MSSKRPERAEQKIVVDPDDPGVPDAGQRRDFEAQDAAFQSAMRRAMADGNESVKEGVK